MQFDYAFSPKSSEMFLNLFSFLMHSTVGLCDIIIIITTISSSVEHRMYLLKRAFNKNSKNVYCQFHQSCRWI